LLKLTTVVIRGMSVYKSAAIAKGLEF
jgi:hypothetical protein